MTEETHHESVHSRLGHLAQLSGITVQSSRKLHTRGDNAKNSLGLKRVFEDENDVTFEDEEDEACPLSKRRKVEQQENWEAKAKYNEARYKYFDQGPPARVLWKYLREDKDEPKYVICLVCPNNTRSSH